MARLEELIAQVADPRLRREIQFEAANLKRRQRFGLVYEEHVPETTTAARATAQVGSLVQRRDDLTSRTKYRVTAMSDTGDALLEPTDGKPGIVCPSRELITVQQLGDPICPALDSLATLKMGGSSKPYHAVINGENYHALQLLTHSLESQVDCIYIDPPYNTGSRDWKYNNQYVDKNDAWRHSKWLSFMYKRLTLARRLLKPDGVIIVTIDEHEVHHLGMLLANIFPEYLRYIVTIVISARGNYRLNFSRVEEHALFICPSVGHSVITGSRIDLLPDHGDIDIDPEADDDTLETTHQSTLDLPEDQVSGEYIEVRHARRRGPDSSRSDRPSMFYPIYISENQRTVVSVGEPIPAEELPSLERVGGLRPIWPIDADGEHRRWRWGHDRMRDAVATGDVVLGKYNRKLDSWTINILIRRRDAMKRIKTVWRHASHDAGVHGTSLLDNILGERNLFSFPKSVYAVRDCLAAVVRERPNALILDFFAGSGTTFHATCLLNAEDGGYRRSILITNNEVDERTSRQLIDQGLQPGDADFEAQGVYERVTRPRVEAVVTGRRPDGTPIPGNHVSGRPFAEGFQENVEFFRLDYLDVDEVELGRCFDAVLPALWLGAGGIGAREGRMEGQDFSIPKGAAYAVLFREARFRQFREALAQRPDVTHAWLITDSDVSFAEMSSKLPDGLNVSMLYRDYLRTFRPAVDNGQ